MRTAFRTRAAWRPGWPREGGGRARECPPWRTQDGGQGDESSRLSKAAHAARAARPLAAPALALPPRSSLACVRRRELAAVRRRAPPPAPALSRSTAPADLTARATGAGLPCSGRAPAAAAQRRAPAAAAQRRAPRDTLLRGSALRQ